MAKTITPPTPPAEEVSADARPFRQVSAETLRLSAPQAIEAARNHAGLPHSPTERALDPARVLKLVEAIRKRTFLSCGWATVRYNGVKYRMNGQHSSNAIVEAADDLAGPVFVHIDHYEVDSPEGMGVLFRQFDARWSGRSKQDVAGAYQGLVPQLSGVNKTKGKLGIEGIAWYERNVEKLPVQSGDELYEKFMVEAYHGFLRWLDRVIGIKTPELKTAAVTGAMYATFITSESGAQEFWAHVAKNDLSDDRDPRSVLSVELTSIKSGEKDRPAPAEFYAKCVKAWNAFRGGEKISTLNVNTKKGLPDIAR